MDELSPEVEDSGMTDGSGVSPSLKETDRVTRRVEDGSKEDYQALVQQLLEFTAAQVDILESLPALQGRMNTQLSKVQKVGQQIMSVKPILEQNISEKGRLDP